MFNVIPDYGVNSAVLVVASRASRTTERHRDSTDMQKGTHSIGFIAPYYINLHYVTRRVLTVLTFHKNRGAIRQLPDSDVSTHNIIMISAPFVKADNLSGSVVYFTRVYCVLV